MNIIPELNLNKHPNAATNNSLVHAENLMLSNDGTVLQNEPQTILNDIILGSLPEEYNHGPEVIYALPCNEEILFFIRPNVEETEVKSAVLDILRYNEVENKAKIVIKNFEYNEGTLLGTFTYNKNNLIIAISEYDATTNVPLKTLNLGKFNDVIEINSDFHPLTPKLKLPRVTTEYTTGIAYKGWYYIFIRYKIDKYNYTQWYNTNANIFIDDFSENNIIDYHCAVGEGTKSYSNSKASVIVSTDSDISNISFRVNVDASTLEPNYLSYQIAFINITKTSQKAFRTEDLKADASIITFDSSLSSISISELIKSYYNYYNVKTLDNINNRLYIGNYSNKSDFDEIDNNLSNITIEIKPKITDVDINSESESIEVIKSTIISYTESVNGESINKTLDVQANYLYFNINKTIRKVFVIYSNNFVVVKYGAHYSFSTLANWDIDDTLELKTGIFSNLKVKAKNLFYVPSIEGNDDDIKGYYIISNGEFIKQDDIIVTRINNKYPGVDAISPLMHDSSVTYVLNKDTIYSLINPIPILSTNGVMPDSLYKLYIHFIDPYGEVTPGFDVSKLTFEENTADYFTNGFFKSDHVGINQKLEYYVNVFRLPRGYTSCFLSYEKFESNVTNTGILIVDEKDNIYFYNDNLNYLEKLSFDFNKIDIYDITVEDNVDPISMNKDVIVENKKITSLVLNKTLLVADSFNNILEETRIYLTLDKDVEEGIYYAVLRNENQLYKTITKELIPCTEIAQPTIQETRIAVGDTPIWKSNLIMNTKNAFVSTSHVLIYNEKSYFDDATKEYKKANNANVTVIEKPVSLYKFKEFVQVPNESLKFNNKPIITIYPISLSENTTDGFYFGYSLDIKNTVDLYKQLNTTIYGFYPKILTNYNNMVKYESEFPKTIRRSHIIQDESNINSWRLFETEEYRNIHENKGNIIKLVGIGKYFIVHTEHSMFLFNGTDTIKSEQGSIQLASVDIINLNYQEVVTSKLGYAGIRKQHHGIIGSFGYIFFDKDAKIIYRYDNNRIDIIDNTITNFIKANNINDVVFGDDKQRSRLFILFKGDINFVLSYNYKINKFISFHDTDASNIETYQYFSTKNIIYLANTITKTYNKPIVDENGEFIRFDKVEADNMLISTIDDTFYKNASISIINNASYELMKYIDNIIYKLNKVKAVTDYSESPVEGKDAHYAADYLTVSSELCSTGRLKIDTTNNLNSPDNYMTPYWRFGNWHFSALRNNLEQPISADEKSRIFGNWFVVKFEFDTNQKVEIESLECKTSIAEY